MKTWGMLSFSLLVQDGQVRHVFLLLELWGIGIEDLGLGQLVGL